MNILANDLKRDVRFVLKIKEDDPENLRVHVINDEKNTSYHWDLEKALNRYYMMVEELTKQ